LNAPRVKLSRQIRGPRNIPLRKLGEDHRHRRGVVKFQKKEKNRDGDRRCELSVSIANPRLKKKMRLQTI